MIASMWISKYIQITISSFFTREIIMKRLVLLFVSTILAVGVVTSQAKQSSDTKKASSQVLKTTIKVPTIICGTCVRTVTSAVEKLDGVRTVKVDLKKKTATVTYASTKVSVDQLEKAIADAGYDANNLKRNPDAYEKLDSCCKVDSKK
jgi:copper ion binding protein